MLKSGLKVVFAFNSLSIHPPRQSPTPSLAHRQSKSIELTPTYPSQFSFSTFPKLLSWLGVLVHLSQSPTLVHII